MTLLNDSVLARAPAGFTSKMLSKSLSTLWPSGIRNKKRVVNGRPVTVQAFGGGFWGTSVRVIEVK